MPALGAFTIPESHPSLPGHFPGKPIVPGVLLLDEAISLIHAANPNRVITGFSTIRFTHPVRPNDRVEVACNGAAVTMAVSGTIVATGTLTLA